MIKFLNLIFFSLYKTFKKDDSTPAWSTICILSILLSFNIITIYYFIRYIKGFEVHQHISKLYLLLLVLIIQFFLYLIYMRKKKHLHIYKEYLHLYEGKKSSAILTNLYIFFSLISFIGTFLLK